MSKLPHIIRYQGWIYRRADVSKDEISAAADSAITALGGRRSGRQEGSIKQLLETGAPWFIGVTTVVSKMAPSSKELFSALHATTIEWCGWVKVELRDGVPEISGMGRLALDGMCFDEEQAGVLGPDDVITGTWNGESWEFERDVRSPNV